MIVGILALIGLIVGWKSGGFLAGVQRGAIFGSVCWYSLIVAGQMVSVFMDRKYLLEEILNETKKS